MINLIPRRFRHELDHQHVLTLADVAETQEEIKSALGILAESLVELNKRLATIETNTETSRAHAERTHIALLRVKGIATRQEYFIRDRFPDYPASVLSTAVDRERAAAAKHAVDTAPIAEGGAES